MNSVLIPYSLLPKGIKKAVVFTADKNPNLPDYGIDTGDLVVVDTETEFVDGELSVFQCEKLSGFRLSKEMLPDHEYFGRVAMVMNYYRDSPFE